MKQTPEPGASLLMHCGDVLTFTLRLDVARAGHAVVRTSLGGVTVKRREVIAAAHAGRIPQALDWQDIPMMETEPGVYSVRVPLLEVGCFQAKTCFFPTDGGRVQWPIGEDTKIKVAPAWTVAGVSVYTAFPRQFGAVCETDRSACDFSGADALDQAGWTVIPPSGTFRSLVKRLDTILDIERFRIVQLLPIHPVPTTFARMGRYGSPFAGTDFLGVNPAFAEFDLAATPIDQFRELVDAVHARGARLFLDLPANHTGWASTLQMHHPEWFKRTPDGRFVSPGAWGTVWEDLVELDYTQHGLRDFMAEVFIFWCRQGVDGFRCDAGYMVPVDVWAYIVARVRTSFPDTVFLLEGLGGKISVTRELISEAGLDWAYSEVFQTEDRAAFEHYLSDAFTLSAETGPLIHFAETHDNDRLAARSQKYATMRTALSALLSHQGCFGITNGVEWFADEKIDVHGVNALRWGAEENQVEGIARLHGILTTHPAFAAGSRVRMVQRRKGNALAVVRIPKGDDPSSRVLVLVNLDADAEQSVSWPTSVFISDGPAYDLIAGGGYELPPPHDGLFSWLLSPGQVLCLAATEEAVAAVDAACEAPSPFSVPAAERQALQACALRIRRHVRGETTLELAVDVTGEAEALAFDPFEYIGSVAGEGVLPPVVTCYVPEDATRIVMLPPGQLLLVRSKTPFVARIETENDQSCCSARACMDSLGMYFAVLFPPWKRLKTQAMGQLKLGLFGENGACSYVSVPLCALPDPRVAALNVPSVFTEQAFLRDDRTGLLTNGRGAMSHVRARWGEIRTQYDALLAANPDPEVPCDRRVLFTRCRAWVVLQGFSTELDVSCLLEFACQAGHGAARWTFSVPVGTGRSVGLEMTLVLHRDENRVTLVAERLPFDGDGERLDDATPIQLILRPDIETRSFHHKTKAFMGPERDWPGSIGLLPGGFTFNPAGLPGLAMRISSGSFVSESEWSYMVGHPEDAARGLDGNSDLFSPGWFTVLLAGGEDAALDAECLCNGQTPHGVIKGLAGLKIPSFETVPLRRALSLALRDFIVKRDAFKTVIAGYPWFLDWGRDTFIVLRGMIADGLLKDSLDIVRTFGAFELDGTLPNMINGQDANNRDTSDAQLWYIVSVSDLAGKMGKRRVLETDCGGRTVRDVLVSIGRGYRRGTPNGIRMDEASGLVYSPSHFTWMDTNHPTGTPRAGYPVEIQALWIASLQFLTRIDKAGDWKMLEKLARASFDALFWREDDGFLSDCLHADTFRPAAEAVADDHLRCNQLFAITLGALTEVSHCRRLLRAAERLLVPGGIRTLAPGHVSVPLPIVRDGVLLNDPSRPYWGQYIGDEDTRRKPAYHNGTAWTWPFPAYVEALVLVYGDSARAAAQALIASAVALLTDGCVGHLPEIMDGDAPHTGRGCDAQAWGASEFLRLAVLLEKSVTRAAPR